MQPVLILMLAALYAYHPVYAQGEENLWFFGNGFVVDFSSGTPELCQSPPRHNTGATYTAGYYSAQFGVQAGICTPAGTLRFLVHIRGNASNAQQYRQAPKVFDATGYSMPNGHINAALTGGDGSAVAPLILPWPGEPDKYFVIYSINSGLLYSVVDMRLNNGLGDIDTARKDILLSGYGTVIGAKYAAVQGCGGLWLVVRSRVENRYLSFRITRRGIDPEPVISVCGLLPSLTDYEEPLYSGGRLAVSPNGKTLAAATVRGIELYDFERCSGRISNPRVIDTFTFLGLCFSPDNNLLYASSMEHYFTTMENYHLYGNQNYPGRVYQYDLGQLSAPAIAASRVLLFENPRVACPTPLRCNCGSCYCDTLSSDLGDLRLAPDGKIYFANNYRSCGPPVGLLPALPVPPLAPMPFPMPAIIYDSSALHVIHQPNRQGWACRPEPNVLMLRRHGGPYTRGETGMWLPLPVVIPPSGPDTIPGVHTTLAACFTDSLVLTAPEGTCYYWDDQSTLPVRTVDQSGIYTVGYFNDDCTYRTDTFRVVFTSLPEAGPVSYSCINKPAGTLSVATGRRDTTVSRYAWYDQEGGLLRTAAGIYGDTLPGLLPGTYTVRVSTSLGCDTVLAMEVLPLPHPRASFEADTLVCKEEPLILDYTAQAPSWTWSLGDGSVRTKERSLVHSYREAGIYTVMLITENPERCTDTAIRQIRVKELRLELTADKTLVSRGRQIYLQSAAPEPYRVIAWLPGDHFTDQQAYRQTVISDTGWTYYVIARSEYGCLDTASVAVQVHPVIVIPTAFTPNGDGRNDLFRPSVSGGAVTIRTFTVFDRWGRIVWDQQPGSPSVGWDGNHNGAPAEVGVYFYRVEIETHTGQTIQKHGDLTLIR